MDNKTLVAAPTYAAFKVWLNSQDRYTPKDVRYVYEEHDLQGYHNQKLIVINYDNIDTKWIKCIKEAEFFGRVVITYRSI